MQGLPSSLPQLRCFPAAEIPPAGSKRRQRAQLWGIIVVENKYVLWDIISSSLRNKVFLFQREEANFLFIFRNHPIRGSSAPGSGGGGTKVQISRTVFPGFATHMRLGSKRILNISENWIHLQSMKYAPQRIFNRIHLVETIYTLKFSSLKFFFQNRKLIVN